MAAPPVQDRRKVREAEQAADASDLAKLQRAIARTPRRVRTPTVLQMEATECGAAALAMVLRHFGRHVPLEQLRVECGVSRDGSKASNVLRAARRYGLKAAGFRKELPAITELALPAIIYWNFNHYVVLEGYAGTFVYLNDPASGPRRVALKEFDAAFTGVCLVFERTPEFTAGGSPPRLSYNLGSRLAGSRAAITLVVLFSLFLVIPGLIVPAFTKVFVDQILIANMEHWLMPLLIGMGVTSAMLALLTWLQQYYLARLEVKVALAQSARFFWHTLRLPIDFYNQRFAGDIAYRVEANDRVAQLLSGPLATSVVSLVTITCYGLVMYYFDPVLAGIAIGLAMLNIVALRAVARQREDGNRRLLMDQGRLAAVSMAGIQVMETLKSSGGESDFFGKWAGFQARYLASSQYLGRYSNLLNAVPGLITSLVTAAVLGVGGLRVMEGALTVGGLIAFQTLMGSFMRPIESLVQFAGNLQTIKGDLSRLDDVLQYQEDERFAPQAPAMLSDAAPSKLSGLIELRDVVFGYNRTEKPLIDGLSLVVRPGQRIALIGGSGSGKSTIAKLISGMYTPWSGEILFDGEPRTAFPNLRFTNSVATVDQEIFLFAGTVRDNVTMWDGTVDDDALTRALRDAAILPVLETRPGRYETVVTENGGNFSGGQRQRLEIARALVNDPTILLLDEATAALDPLVEKEIDDHLRRRGSSCLVVAHRLSTVRDCDEILVLDSGRVVQRGSHDEMIAIDGPYRTLMQAQ